MVIKMENIMARPEEKTILVVDDEEDIREFRGALPWPAEGQVALIDISSGRCVAVEANKLGKHRSRIG